jgi:hypothetical protein
MRQMWDIAAAHMAELDPVQLWPEPFAGVPLGGIGWQALQMQALCRAPRQELLDDRAAMERRTIPDDDHAAGPLASSGLKKPDDVVSVEGVSLAVEGALAAGRDRPDRRQMVARVPLADDRRLTYGGIGAPDAGQGITARCIDAEDRLCLGRGPLLRAAHVSVRHRAMAASSRCRARLMGFGGLQGRASSQRPT